MDGFTEGLVGLGILELLRSHNPRDPRGPVVEELKSRYGGSVAYLAFDRDGVYSPEASLEALRRKQANPSNRSKVMWFERQLYELYRLGEVPGGILQENPLFPGTALEGEGLVCPFTGHSWKGISRKVRQLLCLAAKAGLLGEEIPPWTVHTLLMSIRSRMPNEFKFVEEAFPAAADEYHRLERVGQLPPLTIDAKEVSNIAIRASKPKRRRNISGGGDSIGSVVVAGDGNTVSFVSNGSLPGRTGGGGIHANVMRADIVVEGVQFVVGAPGSMRGRDKFAKEVKDLFGDDD